MSDLSPIGNIESIWTNVGTSANGKGVSDSSRKTYANGNGVHSSNGVVHTNEHNVEVRPDEAVDAQVDYVFDRVHRLSSTDLSHLIIRLTAWYNGKEIHGEKVQLRGRLFLIPKPEVIDDSKIWQIVRDVRVAGGVAFLLEHKDEGGTISQKLVFASNVLDNSGSYELSYLPEDKADIFGFQEA